MEFSLEAISGKARASSFRLSHGVVRTPVFMPVGTQGILKGIDCASLESLLPTKLLLANTYHLYLRPGVEVLDQAGGLHNFASFDGNYLTDSGGFQAFSLNSKVKVSEEGISFRSHIDGGAHFFTPEKVLDIQYTIGSDIMMVLDDLVGLPSPQSRLLESINRTTKWAKASLSHHREKQNQKAIKNKIFAIMQGGIDYELRKRSASELVAMDFDGYAVGGLAVGESSEEMYQCLDYALEFLPANKPRYLMGVGTPENLLECIDRGVDMFDCVMPSRNARNACIFTHGGRLNLRNSRYRQDFSPLDPLCQCHTCRHYSRAYLHHLLRAREISYHSLATVHNLFFYLNLVSQARVAIIDGYWPAYKKSTLEALSRECV